MEKFNESLSFDRRMAQEVRRPHTLLLLPFNLLTD